MIRIADLTDVDKVMRLSETYDTFNPPASTPAHPEDARAMLRAQIAARIESQGSLVILAEDMDTKNITGGLVGDVVIDHRGQAYGKVVSIYARASGLSLLRRFATWAGTLGASSVIVGPLEDERVIKYFSKKGYRHAGICMERSITDIEKAGEEPLPLLEGKD